MLTVCVRSLQDAVRTHYTRTARSRSTYDFRATPYTEELVANIKTKDKENDEHEPTNSLLEEPIAKYLQPNHKDKLSIGFLLASDPLNMREPHELERLESAPCSIYPGLGASPSSTYSAIPKWMRKSQGKKRRGKSYSLPSFPLPRE